MQSPEPLVKTNVPVELSNPIADCSRAHSTLADIRASHAEFQTFFSGVFDGLEQSCDELLAHKIECDRYNRQIEQETLQQQVDRLSELAAELIETVSEQKRLTARKRQP